MVKSLPWQGIVGGAGAGADSGPYNAGEWWSVWGVQQRASGIVVPDAVAPLRTLAAWRNIGVYYGVEDRLEVTDGGAFLVDVATGAALVEGTFFYEDVGRILNIPVAGNYIIVVRKNYRNTSYTPTDYAAGDGVVPAYTTRITWVAVADFEQDTDRLTYWDIPLATIVIAVGGAVTVTDTRDFIERHLSADAFIEPPTTLGTAGNARGETAVDLQQARNAATQIASGDYSTLGGGYRNTASGLYSTVSGGGDGTASGEGASIIGGGANTASGDYTVAGGTNNQATGDQSVALGILNVASGLHSVALGYYSVADKYGQIVSAASIANGAAQGTIQMVAKRTLTSHTNTTWYSLYLDSVALTELITIAVDTAWTFDILLIGLQLNATRQWSYRIVGAIVNSAGTTTLLASTVTTIFESDAAYEAQVVADDANDALVIQVRRNGGSDYDIRWVATVRTVEVTYT